MWPPRREVLERLTQVRRGLRLGLLLLLVLLRRGLLRIGRLDLHRVRATGLRPEDRHRIVQFLGPLAALDPHPAVRAVLCVEMPLVPRAEDFSIAVGAVEGPRLPPVALLQDGNPTVPPVR